MNCCEKCFKDRLLVNYIKKQNHYGICDYCENVDVFVIAIEEISNLFDVFVPYYEKLEHSENYIAGLQDPTEVGETLYELIQSEWEVFSKEIEGITAKSLLNELFQMRDSSFFEDDLYVRAMEAFTYERTVEVWESFSDEIKHGNRFFPSKSYIIDNLISILTTNKQNIFQDAICYRGRIGRQTIDKMGAPPASNATAGRANPKGISYLYAAPLQKTCIAELRPYKTADITIVEFTTNKALNFVALNAPRPFISPFQFEGNLLQGVEALSLYSKLVSELSKPVSPDNSEIEYLPTQFLSELIKNQGYDGFSYKSALGPGDNYVIFDERNVSLNSIEFFQVDDIVYTVHSRL